MLRVQRNCQELESIGSQNKGERSSKHFSFSLSFVHLQICHLQSGNRAYHLTSQGHCRTNSCEVVSRVINPTEQSLRNLFQMHSVHRQQCIQHQA